jgi:hypothetical protein
MIWCPAIKRHFTAPMETSAALVDFVFRDLGTAQRKKFRYSFGVMPVSRLKSRLNWLWS